MGDLRWQRNRPVLTGLRDEWAAALTRAGISAETLAIDFEPSDEPGPGTPWNWWVSFSLGEVAFDAIIAEGLDTVAFEDETGYFDDDVAPGDVPDYLLARLRGHPFRPRRPGRRRRRP